MEDEDCPQCGILFRTSPNFRKMTESCGHVMCRHCAMMSEDGCHQCMVNDQTNGKGDDDPSVTGFVKVQLTETPTLFMTAITSELDKNHNWNDGWKWNPILIHNANTFTFTSGSDQDPDPEMNFENSILPSKADHTRTKRSSSNQLYSGFEGRIKTGSENESLASSNQKKDKMKEDVEPPSLLPFYITVLQKDPPSYHCTICERTFNRRLIKIHLSCKIGALYKCEQEECGEEFSSKFVYDHHLRTQHCQKKKSFVCRCGKAFNSRSNLRAHKRFHMKSTKSKSKDKQTFPASGSGGGDDGGNSHFACSHCDKHFAHRSDFKNHLMIHIDDFPFKCSICGKSAFKFKFNLIKHIIGTHSQPRIVAEKLADDAGLKYLKETMKDFSQDSIPSSKIHPLVLSCALRNSKLILPPGIVTDTHHPRIRQNTVSTPTQTMAMDTPSNASTPEFDYISKSFIRPCAPSSIFDSNARDQPTGAVSVVEHKNIEIVSLE